MTKYDDVTKQIANQLKAGTKPWIKPFNGGSFLPLRSTGQRYKGINYCCGCKIVTLHTG